MIDKSDVLIYLDAYTRIEELFIKGTSVFKVRKNCTVLGIVLDTFLQMHETKLQLLELVKSLGFEFNLVFSTYPKSNFNLGILDRNRVSEIAVLSSIACGLYPNCLQYIRGESGKPGRLILIEKSIDVSIQTPSVFANSEKLGRNEFYTFNKIQLRNAKDYYAVYISMLPILLYPLIACSDLDVDYIQGTLIMNKKKLKFCCYPRTIAVLESYREILTTNLTVFLQNPLDLNVSVFDEFLQILNDQQDNIYAHNA